MNEIGNPIAYKRLRAPTEDGQSLYDPPKAEEAALLRQNVTRRLQSDCWLHERSLAELQNAGRQNLLQKARNYTAQYRDPFDGQLDADAPMILAGHQPELVHPGVWFKNFAASELASRTSAHAVNLLIDNDLLRSPSIRVPGGSVEDPMLSAIPFDQLGEPIPYEHRSVVDRSLFESFGDRVQETIGSLIQAPLVAQMWPEAVSALEQNGNLGQALAQARHVIEGKWGLTTLELPLSSICDDWPFFWFAVHLMANAERLRTVHNACLQEYRRVNRVRSHTHPVPNLIRADGWIEAPFWLWTVGSPHRRPVFVRRSRDSILVTDRNQLEFALNPASGENISPCVDQLYEMVEAGVRLRPRALITTMFARLVLSDVFIHGIGGAKYDQLTDAIVRTFFEIEPPEFLVATATLKLPIPRPEIDTTDVTRIDRLLRDIHFHPEQYVDDSDETRSLISEKGRWIQSRPDGDGRRERHLGIEDVNRRLRLLLHGRTEQLNQERAELRLMLRKQVILGSRELASCLFPEQSLRERLLELSRQEP